MAGEELDAAANVRRKQLRFICRGNSWQAAPRYLFPLFSPRQILLHLSTRLTLRDHLRAVPGGVAALAIKRCFVVICNTYHNNNRGLIAFGQKGRQLKNIVILRNPPLYKHTHLTSPNLTQPLRGCSPRTPCKEMALEHVCSDSAACPPSTRLTSLHANPFLPQRAGHMSWGELPLNGWPP